MPNEAVIIASSAASMLGHVGAGQGRTCSRTQLADSDLDPGHAVEDETEKQHLHRDGWCVGTGWMSGPSGIAEGMTNVGVCWQCSDPGMHPVLLQ